MMTQKDRMKQATRAGLAGVGLPIAVGILLILIAVPALTAVVDFPALGPLLVTTITLPEWGAKAKLRFILRSL